VFSSLRPLCAFPAASSAAEASSYAASVGALQPRWPGLSEDRLAQKHGGLMRISLEYHGIYHQQLWLNGISFGV
jgi:hypothetical protein